MSDSNGSLTGGFWDSHSLSLPSLTRPAFPKTMVERECFPLSVLRPDLVPYCGFGSPVFLPGPNSAFTPKPPPR